MPWGTEIKRGLLGISKKRFIARRHIDKETKKNIRDIIQNAAFIVDISGYALSSQWGWLSSVNYLSNIAISKVWNLTIWYLEFDNLVFGI